VRTFVVIAAFHIFSLNLFQGGLLAELTRWVLLVQHYEMHCSQSPEDLDFTSFFLMHCGSDSHEHDRDYHGDLPLPGHHRIVGTPVFIQEDYPDVQVVSLFPSQRDSFFCEDNSECSSFYFDIFHPPQVRVDFV
jgi:hypothetical protein